MELNKPQKDKEVFKLTERIEIDGQPSNVEVKLDLNTRKATFSVTAKLTTKQLSATDNQRNQDTVDLVADMVLAAVDKGLERRSEILKIQEGSGGMIDIPFPDSLYETGQGERSPTGQK